MQTDVAIEGVEGKLGSTRACPASPQAVTAIDEPAVFLLGLSHRQGSGRYIEIAIDLPVECLEKEVG